MHKLTLLLAACALLSCSDSKTSSPRQRDAGEDHSDDADAPPEDDAGAASSGLERAPGSLPRPPTNRLPDDLKPPER